MTDATTPEQPRTAAGRALLTTFERNGQRHTAYEVMRDAIFAIEAETAESAVHGYIVSEAFQSAAIEAPARPAVASEGLRAALEAASGPRAHRVLCPCAAVECTNVRAALAIDAGSGGALEVPRGVQVEPEPEFSTGPKRPPGTLHRARPAVASEGLRAALAQAAERIEKSKTPVSAAYRDGWLDALHAIANDPTLASDAGSVPAGIDAPMGDLTLSELLEQAVKMGGPWYRAVGIAADEEEHNVYLRNAANDSLIVNADGVALLVNDASDAGSVGALDVERLARAVIAAALDDPLVKDTDDDLLRDWADEYAAAIAAAYADAERQGES